MSNYRNGANLERAIKQSLETDGYYVIKSGGSKGIVDLAAFKPGETLFIQCKLDGYLAPDERIAFYYQAGLVFAVPLVGLWVKEGRAARCVGFRELTGIGPKDHRPWTADHALASEGAGL